MPDRYTASKNESKMPKENKVEIILSSNEALVLFEFLLRFSEDEELSIKDSSEKQALLNLLAKFEKQLVEPFSMNYFELLENARKALK